MDIQLVDLPDNEPFAGVTKAAGLVSALLEPTDYGRLSAALRDVARKRDPKHALVEATKVGVQAGFDEVEKAKAAALADLAVTGRASRARYRAATPSLDAVAGAAAQALGLPSDDAVVLRHANLALTRAHWVDQYLSKSASARARMRANDSEMDAWVKAGLAVSGEDDLPWTAVNVSLTPLVSADITVQKVPTAKGPIDVTTRHAVAGPLDGSTDVILLVHGHTSRIEEVDDLVAQLRRIRRANGALKYSVIVSDLPNCGYSERIDHARIAPVDASGTPVLDFLSSFLDGLVRKLMKQNPGFTEVALVAGGSLGGNLSLRLAEQRRSWLRRTACWSPGSVWTRSHTVSGLGEGATKKRMKEVEKPASRKGYFDQVFVEKVPITGRTQPEHWYWEKWAGYADMIAVSQDDRRELYGGSFRRFHWRVAAEQLGFSHFDNDIYRKIRAPALLMAGAEDNFPLSEQRAMIVHLADLMRRAKMPGWCRLPTRTGHSIHNERPKWLARTLDTFIEAHP